MHEQHAQSKRSIAFCSYVHSDNTQDKDAITWICDRIQGEVRLLIGNGNFDIFLDAKIGAAERWRDRIDSVLRSSDLLIAFLSPAYFQSRFCHKEFDTFRARERQIGRSDLIVPIYYVDARELTDPSQERGRPWAKDLAGRQYADWRPLRMKRKDSPLVHEMIMVLAKRIESIVRGGYLRHGQLSLGSKQLHNPELTEDDKIDSAYLTITATQRSIVQFVYGEERDIAVDDLFKAFNKKYPKLIAGPTELYYRLKDLSNLGLLELKRVDRNATLVIRNERVATVFELRHRLWS